MKKTFEIKNLKIIQDDTKQLISIDSLLIEDFIKINRKTKNILDIGCGVGIISLLLMKRTLSNVYMIDIDKEMIELSKINFENNKDKFNTTKVNFINQDFNNSFDNLSDFFDIIYTNPPYFKENNNISKNNENLNNARFEKLLSIEEIISKSSILLKNGAKFYIIFRSDRTVEILSIVNKYNLAPKRMKFVFTNQEYSKFTLLECIKNGKSEMLIEKPIFLFNNGIETDDLKNIYN